LRILFYQKSGKGAVISSGVHITEVLARLSRIGYSIIFVDGVHYSTTAPEKTDIVSPVSHPESPWERIKSFISTLPFRGEALISFYFLKEIQLFFLALRPILCNKPDLIYRRHTMFYGNYILSWLFSIPSIIEVNGIIEDEIRITKRGDRFSQWIISKVERYNFLKANRYIVVTSELKEVLHKDYGTSEDKIIVVENGANTDLFKPMDGLHAKRELNLSLNHQYICFVGQLAPWQGVEFLISTMPFVLKEYPGSIALIIGDGKMKVKLTRLAAQRGISNEVVFIGKVTYEEVPWYINASDICVAPFVKERNQRIGLSPLKLCEYLACGKPVVASRISGLEILEKYNCGYLINPESPEELAQAIIKLLRDPILRQSMGENGRKYVLENRSWESVAKKLSATFENIVKVLDLPPPN